MSGARNDERVQVVLLDQSVKVNVAIPTSVMTLVLLYYT